MSAFEAEISPLNILKLNQKREVVPFFLLSTSPQRSTHVCYFTVFYKKEYLYYCHNNQERWKTFNALSDFHPGVLMTENDGSLANI